MEAKIKDIIQLPHYPKGQIGIEIEMEGENRLPPPDLVNPVWIRTMDGSLRGNDNAEYVLPQPLDRDKAFEAIDFLSKQLTEYKSRVKDTVRAGVHIHVNMLGGTFQQLWTFATCYYVMEEALTERFCGPGRTGNHFCLQAGDADILTYMIRRFIKTGDLSYLRGDDFRYAALNYTSLRRHGSLEFRALRTPTDLNKIKTWIDMLLSIKAGSKMFANPREVVEQFSLGGEFNFINQMLGDNVKELGEQDEWLRLSLMRGVRLAQEIGYAKEW